VKPAHILVVDDEPGMLRAVRRILSPRYEVTEATTPAEALALLPGLAPELAILDVRMPEMDGFELTSRLKRAVPDLDVILMTGSLGELDAKIVRAIRENAFYFIQKPFDRELLTTLVERCFELRRLSEENRRHTLRLESDLAEARAFQENLLPPPGALVEGLRVDLRYRPCSELGGDLVDYVAAGPGKVALLVADVSGHGVSAAMLTGVVKSVFRSARDDGFDPRAVAARLWGALHSFADERFVTLVAGVVDVTQGTMEYVNAGHPPPFVWRDVTPPSALRATGPLISAALPGLLWVKERIAFPPGGRLLLYTDGVTEIRGEGGDFGSAGIADEIGRTPAGGTPLLEAVLEAATRHGRGRPQEDDWTLLAAGL